MSKKAVLITGGAKRVGAVMALYFAKQGYDIALHYNRSKSDAVKLQKQIKKLGVACELFSLDLQQTKNIPALMAKVKKSMPHCMALINNASVFERREFMKTDEALFDHQLDINFKAPVFLTQAFAKTFGRGTVINLLDTYITTATDSHFAYLLSKKAFAAFTGIAAKTLGPKIRVNGVCPSIMLPSNELDWAYMRKKEKELPLKAIPTPEEVVEAAYWLCENKNITGQLLFVDGGQHLL
jgi:pteridine reductase